MYRCYIQSPLGRLLLEADQEGLTGLWFEKEKQPEGCTAQELEKEECAEGQRNRQENTDGIPPAVERTRQWLTVYFSGQEPDFMPPLHVTGTPFQLSVWEILKKIPYGKTTTYGEIAKEIAAQRGLPRMSAQAVGGAVGHNKISILIPCHRVVGAGGNIREDWTGRKNCWRWKKWTFTDGARECRTAGFHLISRFKYVLIG